MNYKLILPCVALALASTAHANGRPLNDRQSLEDSLNAGHRVTLTVDLSRCVPEGSGQPSQTKGGLTIDAYRVTADSTLSFADAKFTASADNKALMQLSRYRVGIDGSIAYSASIYSLPDHALLTHSAFRCAIGNGVNFIGSHR